MKGSCSLNGAMGEGSSLAGISNWLPKINRYQPAMLIIDILRGRDGAVMDFYNYYFFICTRTYFLSNIYIYMATYIPMHTQICMKQ